MNASEQRLRFRGLPLLTVTALLVLPGLAVYRRLGPDVALWTGAWVAVASLLTFVAYWIDQRKAQKGGWREPERALHLGELLGGWPGAFLAQRWLRHKSAKISYQLVFFGIVGLYQFLALDSLLGWAIFRTALTSAP
jgi:uncharacterized membrane protein YsdA (DUF1294 family)